MALTKTETQALEWSFVIITEFVETGSIDVSDSFETTLHIDCVLGAGEIHTGTEIIIQIASEAGVDDAWTDIARILGPTSAVAPISYAMTVLEAAGQTEISVTNVDTENLDNDGKFKFFAQGEGGDPSNNEVVYQISNTGDAGDTITILDALRFDQRASTDSVLWDIDDVVNSAVGTFAIDIPFSASQARVIFNNNFDPDGAGIWGRVRVTKVTAIS